MTALRADAEHDPRGVAEAISTLRMAYEMIESELSDRTWVAGKEFPIADCSAAPSPSMHQSWSRSHLATSVWPLTSSACSVARQSNAPSGKPVPTSTASR